MAGSSSSSSVLEFIPEDLLFRILLVLPVACLLRLKLVCKSWLSLIESSRFISQHTHLSSLDDNQENKLIILNSNGYSSTAPKFISVIDLQLSNHVDFKLSTDEKVIYIELIASFNGIICLTHYICVEEVIQVGSVPNDSEDLVSTSSIDVVSIWNPVTKHVKILPPPPVKFRSCFVTRDHRCRTEYGFGFDAKTNDYRVVRVVMDAFSDDKVLNSQVDVYSLKMDSWRAIDSVLPFTILINSNPKRPSRNGVCFWLGWNFVSSYPVIVSFDFSNEVFGTILLNEVLGIIPTSNYDRGAQILAFLGEKLACIHWIHNPSQHENYPCKIWVLDKCGEKESWTNLYTIMLESRDFPMGFSVNGKMVLQKTEDNGDTKLFLFDPSSQEFTDIPFQGRFNGVAVYKESLVSVKGANGETYRVDSEWKARSSTWDLTVANTIMASDERFAGILDEDAGGLIIFDEPKIVPQASLPTRWTPPLAGTIKLNTDAMWKRSRRLGTFGWVARNEAGIAVKAACSNPFPMDSIIIGKAEAIRNALCGARNAGWDSIIVESDCKDVVDTIKGSMIKGSSDSGSSISSIIVEITILSTHFKSISFCYVPKDLNVAAHFLACHGYTCDMPCIWDTEMPDGLNDALAKDLVC